MVTDPTIRPITEQTVWPNAQNNKIKFTFNLMKGEDVVSTFSVNKILAYNGYFNKTYAYGGHDNIINRNYTINGDIIISTQDVSVYMDQFSRFRNETWNIETPDDAEIVKVLLYFKYNWDTSFFPNGWNITFNGRDILNEYITHETDRGNLGGWGAYDYGLLVFDVTEYYKANEINSFVINKTRNCALYPSTLFVLYNVTDSNSVKDVYFSDICDVYYPNYNQVGYDDLLKHVVNYNNVNLDKLSNATWYVFSGSSSMNNNLTFNDGVIVNPFAGYTSNDCRPYAYDVSSLIKENNEAWFVSSVKSSTTVAYEQVLVVERLLVKTSISVNNESVDLLVNDEFDIGAVLTPDVGELTYSSDNESVAIVENGKIIAKGAGNAVITVSFAGNIYYSPSNATIHVTVSKSVPNVKVDVVVNKGYYPGMVTVIVRSDVDGVYNVTVADKTVEVNIADGLGYKSFDGIDAGIHDVTVKFSENEIYKEVTVKKEFEILKEAKPNFTVEFGDTTYPNNVSVLINGPSGSYTVKVNDTHSILIVVGEDNIGIGSIGGLAAGTYNDVNVSYSGNKNTEAGFKLCNFTIKSPVFKLDTIIVVESAFTRDATDYYAGERGGMFYAVLKDSNGNPLANKTAQIAVNGPIYTVTTDEQGRFGIRINLAAANTYTCVLSFQGDDNYNAAPLVSSKLTVVKKSTAITASNKVFNAKSKTKTISVKLTTIKNKYDGKTYLKEGKKITLKVNGKTYTAKINSKGIAKFTIKLTKKGKYTAQIKFAGDVTYKASSKSIKITIK